MTQCLFLFYKETSTLQCLSPFFMCLHLSETNDIENIFVELIASVHFLVPQSISHCLHLTPHVSHFTHHTSHFPPHTSHHSPHTSHLRPRPHTSHLRPQTSLHSVHCFNVSVHFSVSQSIVQCLYLSKTKWNRDFLFLEFNASVHCSVPQSICQRLSPFFSASVHFTVPHTSHLASHTSLAPRHLAPHTSHLTPHTWNLRPQTSDFRPFFTPIHFSVSRSICHWFQRKLLGRWI